MGGSAGWGDICQKQSEKIKRGKAEEKKGVKLEDA